MGSLLPSPAGPVPASGPSEPYQMTANVLGVLLRKWHDESETIVVAGFPAATWQFITTPLESHHDRAAFTCGKPSLDNYLRDRAVPDAKGLSTITFVLVDEAE